MTRLVLAVVSNALAILATVAVPGVHFRGNWLALLAGGAILGLFNLIVRPIAVMLSLPLLVLSLGLFYFVLNGILLWAASLLIRGYSIDGALSALLGAVVVGVVNWASGALFRTPKEK